MHAIMVLGVSAVGLVTASAISIAAASSAVATSAQLPQATCAGWDRVRTLRLTGTTELGGLSGTLETVVDAGTGRYVVKRDYRSYSKAEGFDGRLGWSQDVSGASHQLDSSSARAVSASLAWLGRRGWCEPPGEQPPSTRLPDETDNAVVAVVWQVTPPSGTSVILRFDRSNGLLRSFEIRLPYNRLVRHFDDWRRVNEGVWISWAQRDEDPEDESLERIRITSADLSRNSRPAATFARPPPPFDSEILGGAASSTVAYEDDGIGRIYVPVFIDGHGPFAFEVDTGGHLVLTELTAEALQLRPAGSLSNTGGGTGVVHGGLVSTQEIRIGSAVMRKQVAKVLPLRKDANDRGPRPPRAGILGLELFERFVVRLDRARKTLTLIPVASFQGVPRGVTLPIRFNEDAPITGGTFAGIAGDFELDSGDAGPAIVEGYWAERNGLAQQLRRGIPWSGGGVGGEYGETLTRGDFTLGPLKLPHEIASYTGPTDRGSESTRMQAGVIGESTLRRFDMTYDYGHGRVWIDPQPKLPALPFNRAGLRLRRDTPESFVVSFVVPHSPAELAGLKPGDRIFAVNSRPAAELADTDISAMCVAPVGSRVELLVTLKEGGSTEHRILRLAEVLP